MLAFTRTYKYFLSTSTSALVLTALSATVNAQQINNQTLGHITVGGPTYTDGTLGGESIVSNGSANSITIMPASGRVSAGTVRIEGGAGFNATDTDFTGGSRTGAVVLVRDFYAAGARINLSNSTITTAESTLESRGLEARHTNKVTMTGGSITSR